ncbi:MAG: HAD hydrolase-like protein [Povalibacter sp.]
MPAYELIIFDFDGTLADSGDWMIRNFNEIAQQFGIRCVTAAEIELLRGRSNREIIAYMGVPMWKLPRIATEMRRRVAEATETIQLFEGVREMLISLREAAIRTAIVSSNSESNIRRILGTDVASLIDHFECGASLFGKASKLKTVVKRSGVPRARAICIGDETRDIEAAREAGIDSGAVLWGYANAEILEAFKPSMMFASMAQISALAR